MPCRISTDVHERIHEVPAVPAWHPVNPHPGEQSRDTQREEKTLWSFTAACCWAAGIDAERSWEPSKPPLRGWWRRQWNTSLRCLQLSAPQTGRDNGRWAVWLGRHAREKIARAPKGQLNADRNRA